MSVLGFVCYAIQTSQCWNQCCSPQTPLSMYMSKMQMLTCQKTLDKLRLKPLCSKGISCFNKCMCHFRENRNSASKKGGNEEFGCFIVPPFEGYMAGKILALHKFALRSYTQQWSADIFLRCQSCASTEENFSLTQIQKIVCAPQRLKIDGFVL